MPCSTCDRLYPWMSTRDADGLLTDREEIQDIAYDGETFAERSNNGKRTTSMGGRFVRGRGLLLDSTLRIR